MADLEHFTWGGKGVARGLGRVAWVNGTWESQYVNSFNKTNTKILLNYGSYCLIMPLHTTSVFNATTGISPAMAGVGTNIQHGSLMAQTSPSPQGAEPYVEHSGLNPNLAPKQGFDVI